MEVTRDGAASISCDVQESWDGTGICIPITEAADLPPRSYLAVGASADGLVQGTDVDDPDVHADETNRHLVKIVPAGGEPIMITRRAANLCGTLRNASEDTADSRAIPVPFPRVSCERAAKILEQCADQSSKLALTDGLTHLDIALTDGDALQLAELAHWLEADALSGVVCTYLAELIVQCGSPDAVCTRFQVE